MANAAKLLVLTLAFLLVPVVAMPAKTHAVIGADSECSGEFFGLPTWFKYLEVTNPPDCDIVMPKNSDGSTDWQKATTYIAMAIVEILLRIAALVAVGFIIYGGFKFITSQGEPENAKSARETVINAVIGLVVAVAAASIVSFITKRLTS